MPTNDERREVAEILRSGVGTTDYLSDDDFIDWVHGVVSRSRDGHILDRLADFIEPEERTCHIECVKSGPFYDVFRFDCCGKEYSESRTDDGATELPLAVCPFCGAKVVQQ